MGESLRYGVKQNGENGCGRGLRRRHQLWKAADSSSFCSRS
jgi:hypothetical protein